jgi:hypothetical protein
VGFRAGDNVWNPAQVKMGQETRFLAALERVAKVQIQNGLLILLDAEGVAVFKASRKEKLKFQQPESTDRRLS